MNEEHLKIGIKRALALLEHSRFLASMELDVPTCHACDPGDEGAQLAYEHIQDIDALTKDLKELIQ